MFLGTRERAGYLLQIPASPPHSGSPGVPWALAKALGPRLGCFKASELPCVSWKSGSGLLVSMEFREGLLCSGWRPCSQRPSRHGLGSRGMSEEMEQRVQGEARVSLPCNDQRDTDSGVWVRSNYMTPVSSHRLNGCFFRGGFFVCFWFRFWLLIIGAHLAVFRSFPLALFSGISSGGAWDHTARWESNAGVLGAWSVPYPLYCCSYPIFKFYTHRWALGWSASAEQQ